MSEEYFDLLVKHPYGFAAMALLQCQMMNSASRTYEPHDIRQSKRSALLRASDEIMRLRLEIVEARIAARRATP